MPAGCVVLVGGLTSGHGVDELCVGHGVAVTDPSN